MLSEPITLFDFIPYFVLIGIAWILSYNKISNNCKYLILLLFIFASLRYKVGWDYNSYLMLIEGKTSTSDFNRIEWLSRYLMYLARFSFSQLYFIINAGVGLFCLNSVCNRFSLLPCFSVYLFLTFSLFYLQSIDIVRNFTAILMIMYCCMLYFDKRYIYYLLILFLAIGMHSSAIIGLLIPFIIKINWSARLNIILFILSFFVGKLIQLSIIAFSDNSLLASVVYYITNNTEGSGNLYKYILYLINLVFLLNWKRLVFVDSNNKYWITFTNIGVCFWTAFSFQYTLSLRFDLFFIVWMIIVIPSLLEIVKPMYRKLLKQCIYIFFTSLFFFNLYILAKAYNNGELYQASFLPYRIFIFQ